MSSANNSNNNKPMNGNNLYYTLNLGSIEIKQNNQSLYRTWNRLHRFQKTLIVLTVLLFFLYVLTHIEFHSNTLKNIPSNHDHQPVVRKEALKQPNVQNVPAEQVPQEKNPNSGGLLDKLKQKRKIPLPPVAINFKGPTNERQKSVVEAFKHAWKAYKQYAWGRDELKPLSKSSSTWFNLGLTIVDSLDTIYIMSLNEIFDEAREWVAKSLDLASDRYNNLFEITIRIMGGLLSAYNLSGDKIFLEKAYDLGNRTMPAFDTASHIPLSDINLKRLQAKSPSWTSDSSLSEVATLQLEYKELAILTGDDRFRTVASRISKHLHDMSKPDGLVPIYINPYTGKFVGHTITLGARGDSYYEYLLKQWIQNGAPRFDSPTKDIDGEEVYLIHDWLESMKGVKEKLVKQTKPNNLTFVGELLSESFSPKMDHLVCFLPGNLALGAMYLEKHPSFPKHETESLMNLAKELTETCYQMYAQMETGLSPEICYFNTYQGSTKDLYVKEADRHNLLRPETIESLYYLYKITGDKKYQDQGWKIFESFEKYTKLETGYSSISDVTSPNNPRIRDKMESFFLAETLKYFYLLFEDETNENFNLNKWVFNTEAHPLPLRS